MYKYVYDIIDKDFNPVVRIVSPWGLTSADLTLTSRGLGYLLVEAMRPVRDVDCDAGWPINIPVLNVEEGEDYEGK